MRAPAVFNGASLDYAAHRVVSDPRTYLLRFYPELEATIPRLDLVAVTATPLVAIVNGGTWIARCDCGMPGQPAPGGVVWVSTPLVWCVRCENRPVGGGWRPVVAPDRKTRRAIEAVLACRPNVEDRGWEPPETITDLMTQNLEHSDPIPEAA